MNPDDLLMKHFVLSLAAAIAVMTSGLAQCMADFDNDFGDAPFGISPDPALDEAFAESTVGMPYDDTLHILMPTLASDLGGDLPIAIDGMVVQTIALIGAVGEMFSIQDLDLTLTPDNNGRQSQSFRLPGRQPILCNHLGNAKRGRRVHCEHRCLGILWGL